MSGLEIPGLVIGVVPLIFKATVEAWKVIDDVIDFEDESEDLIIRMEMAKAHLGIWATKAGLTDGELVPSLQPFQELIARTLERICGLVAELQQQTTKYGLETKNPGAPQRITATIVQMRRSLHSVIASSSSKTAIAKEIQKEAAMQSTQAKMEVKATRRALWAIHDKRKFEKFVEKLHQHVKGLQHFTVEGDRNHDEQNMARLAMRIIHGLTDPNSLSQLQSVAVQDDSTLQVDLKALANWKSMTIQKTTHIEANQNMNSWNLTGVIQKDRQSVRFLKKGTDNDNSAYLFEKKEYDMNISDDEKDDLRERIRQLLSLLSSDSSERHLQTLKAVGYVDDPDYHCWWIVFRFPLSPIDRLESQSNQPLSLRALYASSPKPPLEARYRLSKRLVDTFAKLYGSDWMHKGITSKNIVFPQVYSPASVRSFTSVHTALIQGFNYSRQLTAAQTIDRGKVLHDLEAAIYRHPNYQGEAATGYQIHYDIYSLGLVLFEIAFWKPIMDLVAAKSRPGKEPKVMLDPNMRHFHEKEAMELKRRVLIWVNEELAYRVGTKYKDAIQWCLNLDGPVAAVEFYNRVAVPLDDLCSQ